MEIELKNLFNKSYLISVLKQYWYSPNLVIVYKNIYLIDTNSGEFHKIDIKHVDYNQVAHNKWCYVVDNHIYWIFGNYLKIMNLYYLTKQSIQIGEINNIKYHKNKIYLLYFNRLVFVYDIFNNKLSYFAKSGSYMDIINEEYMIAAGKKIVIYDINGYHITTYMRTKYSKLHFVINNIIILSDEYGTEFKFMKISDGEIIRSITTDLNGTIKSILIHKNKLIISNSEKIKIWSLDDYKLINTLEIRSDKVIVLNNTLLILCGGILYQYDFEGKFIKKIFNLNKFEHVVSCVESMLFIELIKNSHN